MREHENFFKTSFANKQKNVLKKIFYDSKYSRLQGYTSKPTYVYRFLMFVCVCIYIYMCMCVRAPAYIRTQLDTAPERSNCSGLRRKNKRKMLSNFARFLCVVFVCENISCSRTICSLTALIPLSPQPDSEARIFKQRVGLSAAAAAAAGWL